MSSLLSLKWAVFIDFKKWRSEYDEYREGKITTPPDVPMYAKDSEIRNLIDFVIKRQV